jgi:hypothetical protein
VIKFRLTSARAGAARGLEAFTASDAAAHRKNRLAQVGRIGLATASRYPKRGVERLGVNGRDQSAAQQLPPRRLRGALLLMPALFARVLSLLPVVSPAPLGE